MTKRSLVLIAAAVVMIGGFTFAQTQMKGMDHSSMTMAADPSENPAVQAYTDAMNRMMQNMTVPYIGDPDVDFVQGMIPHHEGAIAMAKVVLEFGTDPEIRALAEGVVAAQATEIGQMKAWLAARGL